MRSRAHKFTAAAALILLLMAGCGEEERSASKSGSSKTSQNDPDAGAPDSKAIATGERAASTAGRSKTNRGDSAKVAYARKVPDPGMVVGALSVPTEIAAGEQTSAIFQTRPRHSCQMELQYPGSGNNQRLEPAVADETGKVSWNWTVSDKAKEGRARVYVLCSGGQRGEVVITVT